LFTLKFMLLSAIHLELYWAPNLELYKIWFRNSRTRRPFAEQMHNSSRKSLHCGKHS